MITSRLAVVAAVTAVAAAVAAPAARPQSATPVHGYRVVNVYPHDRQAFTQGLIYRDGFLFESTGLRGESTLRKVRLETGEVVQRLAIDRRYFAEGLTDWGARLVQLTWDTNVGFVYDLATFNRVRTFNYTGQGWGLARDARRLIMSDGTPTLRFLDPETFQVVGSVTVRDNGRPVEDLNELEMVDGVLYANVWFSERIAMIAPASGEVTGWIDLAGLMPRAGRPDDAVLNGIAWDASGRRLFVTGKLWPRLFEIAVRRR